VARSAVSANRAIAICAACSRRARWPSRYAKIHGTKHRPWLTALLARRPTKVAAIALANKIARMAWAMMAKGERGAARRRSMSAAFLLESLDPLTSGG
jgi:hypothetical protein